MRPPDGELMKTRLIFVALVALGTLAVYAAREDDRSGETTHRWLWDEIEALDLRVETLRGEQESHEHPPPTDHGHPPAAPREHEHQVPDHEHGSEEGALWPGTLGGALAGLVGGGLVVGAIRVRARLKNRDRRGEMPSGRKKDIKPAPDNGMPVNAPENREVPKKYRELNEETSLGRLGEDVSFVAREQHGGGYTIRIRSSNHKKLLVSENKEPYTLEEAEGFLADIHDAVLAGNVRRVIKPPEDDEDDQD